MRTSSPNFDSSQTVMLYTDAGVVFVEFNQRSPSSTHHSLFSCAVLHKKCQSSNILKITPFLCEPVKKCEKRILTFPNEYHVKSHGERASCVPGCVRSSSNKEQLMASADQSFLQLV